MVEWGMTADNRPKDSQDESVNILTYSTFLANCLKIYERLAQSADEFSDGFHPVPRIQRNTFLFKSRNNLVGFMQYSGQTPYVREGLEITTPLCFGSTVYVASDYRGNGYFEGMYKAYEDYMKGIYSGDAIAFAEHIEIPYENGYGDLREGVENTFKRMSFRPVVCRGVHLYYVKELS